jgi:hypothetical protein
MPLTGLASGTFKDVSKTYTFYEEVEFLSSKQIITGFEGGIFRPDVQVTRAEAAIMIGRALGLDGEAKNTKFSDVTANVTGSGYIASAVEILEVLYLPTEPVDGDIYVKAVFKRFIDQSEPVYKPVEISIPLEDF